MMLFDIIRHKKAAAAFGMLFRKRQREMWLSRLYFFFVSFTISSSSTSKIRVEKGLMSPPVSREP